MRLVTVHAEDLLALLDDAEANLKSVHGEFCGPIGCDCARQQQRIDNARQWLLPAPTEPWCPEHGYGCEPSNCPCGHTLRCDCREIAAYEH